MDYPLPPNPLRDLRKQLFNKDVIKQNMPSIDKYKPITSKCGLGKTQGTKGMFRGMQCDSYWEAAWYIYMVDIKGNVVTRNTKDSFAYTDENGNKANFYPDFKMQGQFHEIKGRFRPNDILKRDATLGIVTFWGPEEMKPILKEVYAHDPNWKTEYVEVVQHTSYGKGL